MDSNFLLLIQKIQAWLKQMFKPQADFYWLLTMQAHKTLSGMEAFSDWLNKPEEERCQLVRDLEHDADLLKLEIGKKLVDTFVTPLDREDIYDLSQSLDEVINAAKSLVREIEALGKPANDELLQGICQTLVEGTSHLKNAFVSLKNNLIESQKHATLARKSQNKASKLYQQAMHNLLQLDDFKLIIRLIEIHRGLLIIGEKIDIAGEKLLHVIIKMS